MNGPGEWATGIIKGGAKNDLGNYRAITLLSVVGKLLLGILNEQLTELVEKYDIGNENQAGFRNGYRTTDHIFTLNTIISHTKLHFIYSHIKPYRNGCITI